MADDIRQAYLLPVLTAREMIAVLARAVSDGDDATNWAWLMLRADLRLEIHPDGHARLVLAYHAPDPAVLSKAVTALRDHLCAAIAQVVPDKACNRASRQTVSRPFSPLPPLPVGVVVLIDRLADSLAAAGGERLVVVRGREARDEARLGAMIIRRCRQVTVRRSDGDSQAPAMTVFRVAEPLAGPNGDPDGAPPPPPFDLTDGVTVLAAMPAGGLTLWRDHRRGRPAPEDAAAADAVLAALGEAGAWPAGEDDLFLDGPDPAGGGYSLFVLHGLADAPSATALLADGAAPVQPVAVRMVPFTPSEAAMRALGERILNERFTIGYRVGLARIPRNLGAELDIGRLQEEIHDRQSLIAQIEALDLPRLTLLRFTDAQLPAMIDGLRRLPPPVLAGDEVLYGTGCSSGLDTPAHFLLYDPARVNMTLSEAYWRWHTEDRPMTYWLDPLIARQARGLSAATSVFVPHGQALVPSLSDFGGDIDQTLRLVLGGLFADAAPVVEAEGSQPMFVFSASPDPAYALEVEVFDRAGFAPLRAQIRWLNDTLMVRGPLPVERPAASDLAARLYDAELAARLGADAEAATAAARAAWREAGGQAEAEAADALGAVRAEMEATVAYLRDAHAYLERAGQRLGAIEGVMHDVTGRLEGAEAVLQALDARDADLARARQFFVDRIAAEHRAAARIVEQAEQHLRQIDGMMSGLRFWRRS